MDLDPGFQFLKPFPTACFQLVNLNLGMLNQKIVMLHKRQKLKVKFDKEKFLKFDPSRGGGLTGSTRATMGKTTSVRTGTRPVMNDKTNLGPPATANGGGAKGRLLNPTFSKILK